MQKVLTAEEMREVDRLTTEKYGIPSLLLMENAAHASARVIAEKLGGLVEGKSFLILCGKGNNGGDGAALARILWTQGADVLVYLFGKVEETKGDARVNFEILKNYTQLVEIKEVQPNGIEKVIGVDVLTSNIRFREVFFDFDLDEETFNYDDLDEKTFQKKWKDFLFYSLDDNPGQDIDVEIDALLGTGVKGDLSRLYNRAASLMAFPSRLYKSKTGHRLFVALDLPTGTDANLGKIITKRPVKANLTVTFTAPKPANVLAPASNFNGELIVANIGSPQELIDAAPSQLFLAEKQDAQDWLEQTKFTNNSYKNKRGHALLIAGSENYAGAAVLCGNAAIRSGVGLVTIAAPESVQPTIAARVLPEVMTRGVAETRKHAVSEKAFEEIQEFWKNIDAVAIGSGLTSTEASTRKLVRKVITNRKTPVVIDADGLNSLAPFDLKGSENLPLILTPHEGEFLKLLGVKDKKILEDRVKAVRNFSRKHKVILVLKGERSLIAAPDGRVVVNPTGNSGLGKAGNGDTLTGIIVGFLAQAVQMKVDIFETVVAAAYLAGLAGDIAEKKYGKRVMIASDVRECLAEAFREING